MFRSNGPARVLGVLALAAAVATASTASNEASSSKAFPQDPRVEQRAAAVKRAPAGAAVPSERYLAAAAHVANMPSHSTGAPSLDATGIVVGSWQNLGPSNVGGRTRALIVESANTWFAAGVAGGVFKTTDAGLNWAALDSTPAMANLAVSALVQKPGVPATIWAGTGEGVFNDAYVHDGVRGAGIFQSTNGGTTWAQLTATNNANFYYVNDLIWSANSPTTVYAATNTGVWKTVNSGTTWTQILAPSITNGCLDLSVASGAGDFLVASCGSFTQSKLYRAEGATATSIANWSMVLSEVDMGRTSLSATTATGVIYALAENRTTHRLHAVFRSADGGQTWPKVVDGATDLTDNRLLLENAVLELCGTTEETAGWYANTIAIDPSDATGNTVWSGSIDLFRSTNGGATWTPMSSWWQEGQPQYLPAGQHALVFGAGNMLVAGDGGIYRMTTGPSGPGSFAACPGGGTVSSAVFASRNNGYAVTQFNSAAVDPSDAKYIGGTARGTLKGTDVAGAAGWTRIWADYGGAAAIDPSNPNVVYVAVQDGVRKSTDGGATFPDHPTVPDGYWKDGLSGTFALLQTPLVIDPTNPNRLWIAGDQVFRSDNGADVWTAASAAFASAATAIAVSPSDPEVVLVGTLGGAIHRTTTASAATGATVWASSAPRTGYVSSIAFDPSNSSIIYATYATFGGVHLWKSTNGGASWADADGPVSPVTSAIPDVPINSVVVDPTMATRIYAGTDAGVFVSSNSGAAWAKENTGFPNVITERLVTSGANLYAFTHGRGAWRVPLTNGPSTTTVGFESPRTTVTEQGVAVTVDVVLSTADHLPLASQVTVAYATANGAAGAGADFTATSGTLTFPAGAVHGSTQTMAVTLLEDAIGEPTENFSVNLSAPTGGALLALKTHTVAIVDDGDAPGLSVSNAVVSEGSASVLVRVNLSPAMAGTVTVNYATANIIGGAVSGVAPAGDYTAASGVLSFAPGQTFKDVTVLIRADTVAEPAEDFSLVLSGSVGANIVDPDGTVTINDNDLSGSLQFSLANFTVAESGLTGTVTVTRTGGLASGVTVNYATVIGGSAVAPGDYTTKSGTLNFAANSASQTFTVSIINDTLDEPDETIQLQLSNPTGHGAELGLQSTATLTITDNDMGGVMGFSLASYTANEGTSVTVTVSRTGGTASAVTVNYATAPGTATFPADYGVPTGTGTLTFNANELSKTFSVPLLAENPILVEGPEAFQVVLSNPTGGATVGPLGTATININDASPRVAFAAATTTVSEALTTLAINVMRTGPTTTAVTVPYFTVDGSATAVAVGGNPADYTAASGNLVIPAGAASKAISLVLKVDTVAEGPENLTVHLGTPIGGELGAISIVTVNITDNDFGGALVFSAPSFNVQEPLSGVLPVKATVTVKRTGGTASGVVVPWSTSNGSAVEPGDYTPVTSGSLTFDAGVAQKTFTVDVLPDAEVEGNETINLTLGLPTGGATLGTQNTASIKILDSEPVVQFSPVTVTISENGPKATFTVKRTGLLTGALTVGIADLATGNAIAGSDYNNVPVSVAMASGAAVKTFTVDILQDGFLELPETVVLGLSSCTPGCTVDGPTANAVLTITDDEPLVSFDRITPYTGVEGTPKATFTLKRTGSTASALTVNITDLLTGTATPGVDYANVPATVVIPAAATSKTFTIDVVNDLLAESTGNRPPRDHRRVGSRLHRDRAERDAQPHRQRAQHRLRPRVRQRERAAQHDGAPHQAHGGGEAYGRPDPGLDRPVRDPGRDRDRDLGLPPVQSWVDLRHPDLRFGRGDRQPRDRHPGRHRGRGGERELHDHAVQPHRVQAGSHRDGDEDHRRQRQPLDRSGRTRKGHGHLPCPLFFARGSDADRLFARRGVSKREHSYRASPDGGTAPLTPSLRCERKALTLERVPGPRVCQGERGPLCALQTPLACRWSPSWPRLHRRSWPTTTRAVPCTRPTPPPWASSIGTRMRRDFRATESSTISC